MLQVQNLNLKGRNTMKKIMVHILIVFSLFLIASCSDPDEEAEELIEYNNDTWVPINKSKNEGISELTNELYRLEDEEKEEEAVTVIEEEIIPILDDTHDKFKAVDLENNKVKKLNDLEVEAEELLLEKTKELATHYKGGDVTEQNISQNNRKVAEKFQEVIDYRYELIKKYNLEYVEDDESLGNLRNLKHKDE